MCVTLCVNKFKMQFIFENVSLVHNKVYTNFPSGQKLFKAKTWKYKFCLRIYIYTYICLYVLSYLHNYIDDNSGINRCT